ncbi:MAG TPA: hypothetical protein DIU00_05115, partial [Phycisphaerales bacterium]|nr:hypothetical protein [Phycisphaerales bacterium]
MPDISWIGFKNIIIDVEEKYLTEIRRILGEHVSDCEVRAFGSRIEGKARDFSDLDLVLVGSEKLNWRRIELLRACCV